MFKLLKKIPEHGLPNLALITDDAKELLNIFNDNEISLLYLNFSDPWPKLRHEQRRLTHNEFLSLYNKIINTNGRLQFKTDNRDLFDFSVKQVQESIHFELLEVIYDLHNSSYSIENIMTEYEIRFSKNGPIFQLIAEVKKNTSS